MVVVEALTVDFPISIKVSLKEFRRSKGVSKDILDKNHHIFCLFA